MKITIAFLSILFLNACSSSQRMIPSEPKKGKQAYQVQLSRFVLARPPEHYLKDLDKPIDELTAYSTWVSQYHKMAELSIWSGVFKEGNCEIAIEDANRNGKFDDLDKDCLHLLHLKDGFSDWSDLNSNSIVMKAENYFKVNNRYYSVKVVENNGPVLMIETVDAVSINRCMFFPEEVPTVQVELQEIASKRIFPLSDILAGSKKQYTVLNFWATYCEPCIREIPTLNEIGNYANMVAFCGNASNYDGNIVDFIQEKNLKGTHCYSTKNLERLFCQNGFPHFVVLDKKGNIILKPDTAVETLQYLKKQ